MYLVGLREVKTTTFEILNLPHDVGTTSWQGCILDGVSNGFIDANRNIFSFVYDFNKGFFHKSRMFKGVLQSMVCPAGGYFADDLSAK